IRSAQCPLCQTTFEVTPEPEVPISVPVTLPPPVNLGPKTFDQKAHPPAEPNETHPFRFGDEETRGLTGANSLALGNARAWLKAAAAIGLAHSLTCGCCNTSMALEPGFFPPRSDLPFGSILFTILLLWIVGYAVMWNGAAALERRRNY